MASAIDDWPVRVLVSLKRGWRSPLEAYTLCLAWYRVSTSRQENAHGHIYRTGRARVKLHARVLGPSGKRLGSHVVESTPQWIQLSPSGGPPLARFGFTAGLSPASNQMVVSLGRIAEVGPGHLIADT